MRKRKTRKIKTAQQILEQVKEQRKDKKTKLVRVDHRTIKEVTINPKTR
jgi:hypothetical protein